MGNFIAKAFVETSKEVLRGKVIDTFTASRNYSVWGDIIAIGGGWVDEIQSDPDAIDCNFYANGDEDLAVKLFLALAEMRDDTNIGRWYSIRYKTYDGYGYDYVRSRVVNMADYIIGNHAANSGIWNNYSKLTPLELAEAVMRGDVKL